MDPTTLLSAILSEKWLLAAALAYAWWAERKERMDNAKRCAEERMAVSERLEALKGVLVVLQERMR